MNKKPKEEWRTSILFPAFMQVSNMGGVRTLPHIRKAAYGSMATAKGKVLKPVKTRNGYLQIRFSVNGKIKAGSIHRAIAFAFIPNPKNAPCVNHKNGIKTDNRVENLEWCTHSENHKHAYAILGRKTYDRSGAKNHKAKLTEADVLNIRSRKDESRAALAREFKVSGNTICWIISGRIWSKGPFPA